MDDMIKAFLEKLKFELAGLPEAETKEALDYYEEYLYDAMEEGKSAEELLSQLDSPEKIAAIIKAETSIRKAQTSPGLKNYSKALKYARLGITKPFSIFMFSIFIFITYSIALILFLSAIVSVVAACVILPGTLYEAFKIPSVFIAEIIGTISLGLLVTALCMLMAYGFSKLCRIFIKLSSGLIGLMMNKSNKPSPGINENPPEKRKSSNLILKACLVSLLAGFVLLFVSGFPVKLFMIFNSMEPSNITTHEWEYDSAAVDRIIITSAHSHIRLEESNTDKITISYEQPDWMEPETSNTNGHLTFTEKSNGRLPLFSLMTLHENRTDVVISLPTDFKPDDLKLESRGGFVYIKSTDYNVNVKTYTGSIFLEPDADSKPADIKATTSTGLIQSGNKDIGTKTSKGLEYNVTVQNGSSIKLETSRGSIFIE